MADQNGTGRAAAGTPAGWYCLDPQKQPLGPYDSAGMAGGKSEWQPLGQTPELKHLLQLPVSPSSGAAAAAGEPQQASTPASVAAEIAQASNTQHAQRHGGAVVAAAPSAAPQQPAAGSGAELDELSAFQAEIAAIEEETAAQADDVARADTPPPDEQQFEDDDGTLYVWDGELRKFLAEGQREAARAAAAAAAAAAGAPRSVQAQGAMPTYNEADMVFQADDVPVPTFQPPGQEGAGPGEAAEPANGTGAAAQQPGAGQPGGAKRGTKRTGEDIIERERAKQRKAAEAAVREPQWTQLKYNTSVYVTGLPDDTTEEEVAEVFRKCGMIKEDADRQPKVRVYRDVQGNPKGDGSVTYLKDASVPLACNILDGAPFRPGMQKVMTVQVATFQQKGSEFKPKAPGGGAKKKKKQAAVLLQKQEKALGWGGFDDKLPPYKVTVVLKHMFHPDEFEADPSLLKDLEDDIAAECVKLGTVEKVRVMQHNPDGVVLVKFVAEEAAQQCLQLMHGRFFGGRQVQAHMWDGVANYFVASQKETPEEQAARLERYAKQLEGEAQAAEAAAAARGAAAADGAAVHEADGGEEAPPSAEAQMGIDDA